MGNNGGLYEILAHPWCLKDNIKLI